MRRSCVGISEVQTIHNKLYQFDTPFDGELPFGHERCLILPVGSDCVDSGIVLSYDVEVYDGLRGQGLGQLAHTTRLDRLRQHCNYIICTVARDNDPQLHILKKNGWVRLVNTSSSAGTPIYLMGRSLK